MDLKKIIVLLTVVWLAITIVGAVGLRITLSKRVKDNGVSNPGKNTFRLAFFADPHITNENMGVQTLVGGPSYKISQYARYSLNKIHPDAIFGLGDPTTHAQKDEWVGYGKWVDSLDAEVYDILGNHDRRHLPGVGDYGTGWFEELDRVSDTKVLKMGNNIFILISEEHRPEFDGHPLASTIPNKRFEFVERFLEEYSGSNNIFIMSHTPISETTAFSGSWFYGFNRNWIKISNKFKSVLEEYENSVVAHFSGHVHTDYRMKDDSSLFDQDLYYGVENVGKFVSGSKIKEMNRNHPPQQLPNVYFMNMPVVDSAHGWIAARFHILSRPSHKLAASKPKNWLQESLLNLSQGSSGQAGDTGPRIFDFFYNARTSTFLGRGAVYYFDLERGENSADVITRWISGNRDVESYELLLSHPVRLGDGEMELVGSDLSLREKENLVITRDNWFKVEANGTGMGIFSKWITENEPVEAKDLTVESYHLENYSVEWVEGKNKGENWKRFENLETLGKVDAVKFKMNFEASNQKDAYIEDIW